MDLMPQLRQKDGLFETPWLHAATKSQQVWTENFSLHILELLWRYRLQIKEKLLSYIELLR